MTLLTCAISIHPRHQAMPVTHGGAHALASRWCLLPFAHVTLHLPQDDPHDVATSCGNHVLVFLHCRGCALLVGVGGSGKQSLARFAAYVADCDLHTVSMSAGYNLARFRQEVKHAMKVSPNTRPERLEVADV